MKQSILEVLVLFQLFTLTRCETVTINWKKPADGTPYPDMYAVNGDTLIFEYDSGFHDVWIHFNNDCEMHVDRQRVKGQNGPGEYEFTEGDQWGKRVFFSCDFSAQDCEQGQHLSVYVFDTIENKNIASGNPLAPSVPPPTPTGGDEPSQPSQPTPPGDESPSVSPSSSYTVNKSSINSLMVVVVAAATWKIFFE